MQPFFVEAPTALALILRQSLHAPTPRNSSYVLYFWMVERSERKGKRYHAKYHFTWNSRGGSDCHDAACEPGQRATRLP